MDAIRARIGDVPEYSDLQVAAWLQGVYAEMAGMTMAEWIAAEMQRALADADAV